MHIIKSLMYFGSLSTMTLALAACNQGNNSQAGSSSEAAGNGDGITVTIGTVNPLTGPLTHWGVDSANGIKMAIEDANAKKMVWDGKPVTFKLISEDDIADPRIATQMADRLVDAKVSAVVGHFTTSTAMPASLIYNTAGIPHITYSVTGAKFTQQGLDNVYRVIANDSQQAKGMAKFAVDKLGMKTFVIAHDKGAYGEGLATDFAKEAEKLGAKMLSTEYTTATSTEFGSMATAIKTKQPDFVLYGGMDAQAGPLAKEMRRQGVKAKFMGSDGIKSDELIKLMGPIDDVYASTAGSTTDKMNGYKDFSDRYQKEFKQPIVSFAPYAYDATNVIIAAMEQAKSSDPAKYKSFIKQTNLQGVTGPIAFDDKGDLKESAQTLYIVKDGKWEVVQ